MKSRTGKECKKIDCVFYVTYVNWAKNLGNPFIDNCMNCKHAHVSQYINLLKQDRIASKNR